MTNALQQKYDGGCGLCLWPDVGCWIIHHGEVAGGLLAPAPPAPPDKLEINAGIHRSRN